jgi:hypothetical protein
MRQLPQRLVLVLTWIVTAMVVDGSVAAATQADHPPPSTSTSPPIDMTVRGDTLMVAGDITCTPTTATTGLAEGQRISAAQAAACITNARAVHNMAVGLRPAGFLLAGDLIEPCGTLAEYQATFDPIWGDQWNRLAPAMGNHEYCGTPGQGPSRTSGWASTGGGYFDYFGGNGGRARPANASYYSFDVLLPQGGHWHVVVLNSACGDYNNPPLWVTPSCSLTGAMLTWLRADLDADRARCELVMFHEPAFATPAPWGGKKAMRTPWWTMEVRGVDLIVTGHNHAYERFAQQDHTGRRSTKGIRSVIVGTGGNRHIAFRGSVAPNSLVRDDGHHGMLHLKLRADGWTQSFRGVTGATRDAVAAGCRP